MSWLVDLALVLVGAVHLVAVNLAGVGPLVACWLDWLDCRGRDANAEASAAAIERGAPASPAGRGLAPLLARRLLVQSWWALLLGGLLGLGLVGLMWIEYREEYFAGWRHLAATRAGRIRDTAIEWVFSLGCYGLAWWKWHSWRRRWALWLVVLLGATNLLYHFPTLFVVIGQLGMDPRLVDEPYHHLRLLAQPAIASLVVHHLLAAVALAGLSLMMASLRVAGRISPDDHGDAPPNEADGLPRELVWGARLALVPTLVQVPVGVWVLAAAPPLAREAILGADQGATAAFALGVLASLALARELANLSLGVPERPAAHRAVGWFLLTVVLMVGARHQARVRTWHAVAPAVDRAIDAAR